MLAFSRIQKLRVSLEELSSLINLSAMVLDILASRECIATEEGAERCGAQNIWNGGSLYYIDCHDTDLR
jgi:hypothetical protein